jgi:hypothetical protein
LKQISEASFIEEGEPEDIVKKYKKETADRI